MKKISVVIPVYNAMTSGGGHISRCIDSVLSQKDFPIQDIEILAINDGSKDNSLDVLRGIKRRYPDTIRLINQKNMGVARTRNEAIQQAAGEYVIFLDQDDWLDQDYCASLYDVAVRTKADVVVSGYSRPDETGKIVKTFQPKNSPYGRYTLSAAWAKIHRTEFLRQNEIEFFNNSYGEDLPFTAKENISTKKHHIIEYAGYNWFLNEQSVSNTSQKGLAPETIRAIENLFEKLCRLEVVTNQRDYNYFLLRTAIYSLLFSGRVADKNDFLKAKQRLFQILKGRDEVFFKKNIHRLIKPPVGEIFTVRFVVAVFIVLDKLGLMPLFAVVWCKQPKNI